MQGQLQIVYVFLACEVWLVTFRGMEQQGLFPSGAETSFVHHCPSLVSPWVLRLILLTLFSLPLLVP